jgi:hypothetical protein
MNRSLATSAVLLVGGLVAGSAPASEKPIDRAAVPAPVLQAAAAKYPKATVTETVAETEKDRTLYEVRMSNGGAKVDLKLDQTGKLLAEEQPVAMKALPKPVQTALSASQYKDWKVQRIEKVENLESPDRSGFELIVEKKGKAKELLFSGQGKLIEEEDEDDLGK